MKKQLTLAVGDLERYRKPTRRERFLGEMDAVVPWGDLVAVVEPYYPKATSVGGRPPVGLERMLRIACLQLWFDLSDPAMEEALYDSRAMRAFVGMDLGREPVPDETTVMRFRHLKLTRFHGHPILTEEGVRHAENQAAVPGGVSSTDGRTRGRRAQARAACA